MIIYVDKSGKEIERVEETTYTYVDKNGNVIKGESSEASKKSDKKAAKPKKVVSLKKEAKDKK